MNQDTSRKMFEISFSYADLVVTEGALDALIKDKQGEISLLQDQAKQANETGINNGDMARAQRAAQIRLLRNRVEQTKRVLSELSEYLDRVEL
jgi:hypothetical protein